MRQIDSEGYEKNYCECVFEHVNQYVADENIF